ncbi:transmembrane 6 superfamily member 1 [Aplysia californica]|uniref:Transmembrane 6 superfamily member 1 n=1 Tax=Aplysia californica TaxID=6500 RepID=A0ABM0JAW5_APLCA|nr:transmembrane 6 superfamily member 1 [Aplysia californica]XP_005089478.1 transmembrane 6 superfamily member 1 [Aplysia californica]
MTLKGAAAVFLTSLLALPISYTLDSVSHTKSQGLIFLSSFASCLAVAIAPWLILRNRLQKMDPFFYALSLLTYRSVQSLVIALENDGLIAQFMGFYLREGEPYLKTAHGTMVSYWDGIIHYSLYLMILAAVSWNQSFYDVGLYWFGSYGNGSLILVLGVFMGKDGIRSPLFLHLPLVALSLWAAVRFINEKRQECKTLQAQLKENDDSDGIAVSIWKRPVDLCFIIFFILAAVLAVFRFIAAFGGSCDLIKQYTDKVEPYLADPLPYSKAQCMVHMLYFIPYYGLNIYGLLWPGQAWMPIWSLVFAGAAGQGQVSYIGSSFHYRTPYIHRVPQTAFARSIFWLVNGAMLVVPHLVAYRCQSNWQFFLMDSQTEKVEDVSNSPSNGSVSGKNVSKKNE